METNTPNSATRPMRLLSIDGGGLKGLIPAEALIAIETQLDALTGRSLPLSDRFDLIGGTSTGAILAVGLALGLKAADLRDFYLKFGKHIFTKVFLPVRFWHSYPSGPLEQHLKDVFGKDTTLGSVKLRTNIVIVSKNVTLGTTWFFTNNPKGKYLPTIVDCRCGRSCEPAAPLPPTFRRVRFRFRTTQASPKNMSSSTAESAVTTIPQCRFFSKPPTRNISLDGPPEPAISC